MNVVYAMTNLIMITSFYIKHLSQECALLSANQLLEMVAKTVWHHSSYHCLRLVLVTINSSMQYATTQHQGPRAYIIGTDSCIRVVSKNLCCATCVTQFLHLALPCEITNLTHAINSQIALQIMLLLIPTIIHKIQEGPPG